MTMTSRTTITRALRTATVALLSASLLLPSAALAVPASEAATVKPGKVIDTNSIKMLFKKKDKAVIAGYQVAFVTRNKATAHAMNLMGQGTAKASLETFLGNVDYAQMQAIVDAARATFEQKLRESGVEVISSERLAASKAYQSLEVTPASAAKPYKVEFQGAHYIVVPATGTPLWFNKYDGLGAAGNQSKQNIKLMAEMSKELDAVVLAPSFAVDFSYMETSGGKFAQKAGVSAQNGMLIVPPATVFWGSTEALVYPKFVDGFWAEGGTGTFVSAAEANNAALVSGLAGMGIDIGPVTSKKALVLQADPQLFHTKTVELLDGAAELLKRAIQDVRK